MPVKTNVKRPSSSSRQGAEVNRLLTEDRAFHDWYRFVLSYPPHLVRDYLKKFGVTSRQIVLDPFCGTGTTLVECKKLGVSSLGIEANPMAHFASSVKVRWQIAAEELIAQAGQIAEAATRQMSRMGLPDEFDRPLFAAAKALGADAKVRDESLRLSPEQVKLLLANSISPRPLAKTLILRQKIGLLGATSTLPALRLALAKATVNSSSNLHFGPEVGVARPKSDAPVVSAWLAEVQRMAGDLSVVRDTPPTSSLVHHADARAVGGLVQPASISAVITSPPYPNEKDYTRTTRLESVLLGFLHDKAELRKLKKGLLCSNTRNVYKGDSDDRWVEDHAEIQRIAAAIEARRIELGKTSGFERMYHRVTKLYFGGMARHLHDLKAILKPGAKLAYVVGDQASYLRVMIRTGELLADIARSLGYKVLDIELFRTRLATATKEQLREEVVLLEWPGSRRRGKNA